MGMHKFRVSRYSRRIEDPLAHRVAISFAEHIVSLRLKHGLSRLTVVQRAGIYWKRMRRLEEATTVPTIDELVKLADLYGISHIELLEDILSKSREANG